MVAVANDTTVGLRAGKKQALRHRILATAEKMMLQSGLAGLNMRDLAMKVGIAYQTLYNHFPSRARIIQGIIEKEHAASSVRAFSKAVQHGKGLNGTRFLILLRDLLKERLRQIDAHDKRLLRELLGAAFTEAESLMPALGFFARGDINEVQQFLQLMQEKQVFVANAPIKVLARATYHLADRAFMRYIIDDTLAPTTMLDELIEELDVLLRPYWVTKR